VGSELVAEELLVDLGREGDGVQRHREASD